MAISNRDRKIIGILLAAGRGRRMGRTKQLLPWPSPHDDAGIGVERLSKPVSRFGESAPPESEPLQTASENPLPRTVVASAFNIIARHCDAMIVALGHDAEAICDALAPRPFQTVMCEPDAEMFESIRACACAAQQRDPHAWALLHPADHPQVARSTIEALLDTTTPGSWPHAIMPTVNGRGGHPVLISPHLLREIIAWPGEGGLRAFWRERDDVVRIAVDDPGAVRDLDTPADYR